MTLENLLHIGKLKAHPVDEARVARLLEGLPKTIGMDPQRVQVLGAFRKMRNLVDYRGAPVSDSMAAECRAAAAQLIADVRAWLGGRR